SGKTEAGTAPRVDAKSRVPAEDLLEGRTDDALAGYKKIQAADPKGTTVAETRFNQIGYGFLLQKDYPKAIAVFRLNTQLYPNSANTYDSLGEALEKSGDNAGAIAMYKKSIEIASKPGNENVDQNGPARAHSEERLKALGAS